MTYNYYINGNCRYIYDESINKYSAFSVNITPSGYFLDDYEGKPDDKYLVKAGISHFLDMYILEYSGVRTNHDCYWWDYDVKTYVSTPNDERLKFTKIGDEYYMMYNHFNPRYRVYKYRGDFYIWCCDEHVIRRIISAEGPKVEYDEFIATDKYYAQLETDWELLAEFNTWYDCFYNRRVRFKTQKEIYEH